MRWTARTASPTPVTRSPIAAKYSVPSGVATARAVRTRPTTSLGTPMPAMMCPSSSTRTSAGTPLRSATVSTRYCSASTRSELRLERRSYMRLIVRHVARSGPVLGDSVDERPLGRRHARDARLDLDRFAQRAGQGLEADLDDVVQDLAAVHDHVQVALRPAGERLEEHRCQLHVPRPDLRPGGQRHFPDEVRAAREIERARGPRLVHRQRGRAVAKDARLVAERLGNALPDHQAQVLGRVVTVDLDVARGPHRQVD